MIGMVYFRDDGGKPYATKCFGGVWKHGVLGV